MQLARVARARFSHLPSAARARFSHCPLPPAPVSPNCHLPTALEALPRLSDQRGGPKILVERDDATGLAFGGNKTRKLEFLIGQAPDRSADE
jgi:hypothetical protein